MRVMIHTHTCTAQCIVLYGGRADMKIWMRVMIHTSTRTAQCTVLYGGRAVAAGALFAASEMSGARQL